MRERERMKRGGEKKGTERGGKIGVEQERESSGKRKWRINKEKEGERGKQSRRKVGRGSKREYKVTQMDGECKKEKNTRPRKKEKER